MRTVIAWIGIGVFTMLAGSMTACGDRKQDDRRGAQATDGGSARTAPSATAPDKATVDALDCRAACATSFECARKRGITVPGDVKAQLRDCELTCKLFKAGYDPARDLPGLGSARTMLEFAAGRCVGL